jgi:tRNA-specific 2-thiouridylase
VPECDRQYADDGGVLVGMSGGVDSAVAALVLKERGYRVVGATLRLWSDPSSTDDRTCCSPESVHRARSVANSLGIPHLIINAGETFHEKVVQYFVDEHAVGHTPNPCVKCNSRLRFGFLLDVAHRLGLARIATGHYARLAGQPAGLARAADHDKDQSYVLAEVDPALLRQVVFPLGEMTKPEVRERAAAARLACHSAPESQEICFVPGDDHRRFLRERLGDRPGAILNQQGRQIGRHSGTYNFTIGQRKGIGVAAEEPLYVVSLAPERQEVVVGSASDIAIGTMKIAGTVRHRASTGEHLTVQWRSTGGTVPARLLDADTIVLGQPATGVSPGQTAVMYAGDTVVLGATIQSTQAWSGPWQESLTKGEK